jgi:hypothetical protein
MAIPMTIKRTTDAANDSAQSLTPGQIMEQVLIKGDLKNLSEAERARYYTRVCESVGLNPLTRPLEYITLNGKLTLYARKDCTDQLRKMHGISVLQTVEQEMEGVYIIITKVKDKTERTDEARGAVSVAGLKGEALANAIMKCETKSKRRATLSISGLGFLDETEIEDVTPTAKRKSSSAAKKDGTTELFNEIVAHIRNASDTDLLNQIADSYAQELADLPIRWSLLVSQEFEDRWRDLGGVIDECPVRAQENAE